MPSAALPRSVGKTALAFPYQLNSPTEALIDLKVRRRLGRLIPVWDWLNGFTGLRITVIPQRRPACRGDARRLCLCPYMFQYLADVGAVRDEGDDAHLPATQGAQQREHHIDAGHQHRPQVVRRALGLHRLGRLGQGWKWIAHPKCALACTRVGWLGAHLQRLRRLHRYALRHLRDRSPVRRIRRQHTKVAVAVRARGRHQLGDTVDQLQWREVQFFACFTFCTALVSLAAAGLAVLLGAAVDQLAARFAQPLHRKRRARAVPQQPLQARAVVRCYANAGVHRETAVLVGQHLFGLETLQQAPPDKGAQDAPAQAGLHLAHGIRIRIHIHGGGWVEDDAQRAGLITGLVTGLIVSISTIAPRARHFLKHAIDCANVKVHMLIEAGAEAVDEGDRANVQCCLV